MTKNHPFGHHVRAIWKPGWHRLDQSLEVGQLERFWFHAKPSATQESEPLSFFNSMTTPEKKSEVRTARIVGIRHPELGPLRKIDTAGMDYVFYGTDGKEFIVNAEEEPGMIYDDESSVTEWSIEVVLGDISEPLSELV